MENKSSFVANFHVIGKQKFIHSHYFHNGINYHLAYKKLYLQLVRNLFFGRGALHKLKITFGAHGGDLGAPLGSCHPSEMFLK